MLFFDEKFFEGEWRSDFYVQSEMKRVWAAQIEILMEIDRICRKHGIRYFADSGTLLGVIRHKGFIPWDDDIDIAMKRADYMRFRAIVEDELIPDCIVWDVDNESWSQGFMRISNYGRELNEYGLPSINDRMKRFHGCPYVVGIDIFPLDNLPEDEAERSVMYEMLRTIQLCYQFWGEDAERQERAENLLMRLEKQFGMSFDKSKNIKPQLLQLFDRISSLYTEDECSELAITWFWTINDQWALEKSWYDKSIPGIFENIILPMPAEYDAVLRTYYGEYMTPVRDSAYHDYPFYKGQKEMLEKEYNIFYAGNKYIKIEK